MSKQGKDDDTIPESYTYSWSKESTLPLDEFLAKYRPSMVQDDGNKPWIWVSKADPPNEDADVEAATKEAAELLTEITEKVEKIKNDPAIPTRSNKKTGARSKKELREEIQAEATEKLKQISQKHGFVSGKWLIFAPSDKVDQIWSKLAKSLISGPLSCTSTHLAKVATSPRTETPNYQHVLCVYIPDVYDEIAVREVMKVLLRHHGVNLSGVKSNLYTVVGIDSKHPSGISSTVWKNTGLMKDTEIKELKDAFFAELGSSSGAAKPSATAEDKEQNKAPDTIPNPAKSDPAKEVTKAKKPQPRLKKKEEDTFVSDDEGEDKFAPPPKGKKPAPKLKASVKTSRDDPFASASDEEAAPAKKPASKKPVLKAKAKPASSAANSKAAEDDDNEEGGDAPVKSKKKAAPKKVAKNSDEDDDEPPRKKRGGRK